MRPVLNLIVATHPLWQCGLRPFFTGATIVALVGMLPWLALLGLGIDSVPGAAHVPVTQWHAVMLLSGMGQAAVAGFLLTAIPEFTETPAFAPSTVRALALSWLAAVVADIPGGGSWAVAATILWAIFVVALLVLVAPRILAQPGRPHRGFVFGVAGTGLAAVGAHASIAAGLPAQRWLDALLAAYMVLMVLSMSRISMRIVNDALDARRKVEPGRELANYLARPPRRNLAVVLITAHALIQWRGHDPAAAAWLALAAAAAICNVLNDWHVGRALLRKWPLLLYLVYVAMACGYAVAGVAGLVGHAGLASAGRHVMALTGFGLGILGVLAIAGRNHVGLPLDERKWLPLAAMLLVAAAVLRAAAPLIEATSWALLGAGVAWCGAFALVLWRLVPAWCTARADGRVGCAEPG